MERRGQECKGTKGEGPCTTRMKQAGNREITNIEQILNHHFKIEGTQLKANPSPAKIYQLIIVLKPTVTALPFHPTNSLIRLPPY